MSQLSSPSVKAVDQEFEAQPTVDFEQYAKSTGIDTERIKKEIQQAPASAPAGGPQPNAEPGLESVTGGDAAASAIANKSTIKKDIAKGVGQGIAELGQGVANAGISLANWVEDTAAEYGIGKGDLISDNDKIDWAKKLQQPNDSLTVRAARGITKVAVPVAATLPFTGPVGAVASAGAAGFFLNDPQEERLSNLVTEHVPELKNYPVAYATLDWLAKKPNESEFDARLKGSLEQVLVAAPIAAGFHYLAKGVSKVQALRSAEKIAQNAPEATQATDNVVTSAETGAMKIGTGMDEAVPPGNVGAEPVVPPENVVPDKPLYNYEPVVETPLGPKPNPNNTDVVAAVLEYRQANPVTEAELLRAPKDAAQLSAEVKGILADKNQVTDILNWRVGMPPLLDDQTKALQYINRSMYGAAEDAAKAFTLSGDPEDLLHFRNVMDANTFTGNIKTGTGSTSGAVLNSHKLSAEAHSMGVDEFNKMLTQEQRKKLVEETLKSMGGKEANEEMAKHIAAISDMGPDEVEKALLLITNEKTVPQKVAGMLQAIAINGMLSSVKTTVGNHLSNATTYGKGVVDAYVGAGVSWVNGIRTGTPEALTIQQANAQLMGSISAMGEAFGAMGTALKRGRGGPANFVNGDVLAVKGAFSAAELGIDETKSGGMRVLAKIADTADLVVSSPSRINATADSFWGTLMYRGKIHEMAVSAAQTQNLEGEAAQSFIKNFVSKPTQEIHEAAKAYAMEGTFAKALDPNSMAAGLQGLIDKIPMGKVLFPFFKTASNIIEYGVKNTPVGLMHPEVRRAIQMGGREAEMAVAKMTSGGMVMGMFAAMSATGNLTGDDTRNLNMQKALQESGQGFMPNAVKVGDKYVSINRIEPLNSVARLGAAFSNISGLLNDEQRQNAAWEISSNLAAFFTPERMVETWNQYLEAGVSVARSADGFRVDEAKAQAGNLATTVAAQFVPFSGLQRDIKNEMDPIKGDMAVDKNLPAFNQFVDKFINKYKAMSPWYSEDLPMQRNMFGEEVRVPDGVGPDIMSPVASNKGEVSPVVDALNKLGGFYEDQRTLDTTLQPLNINMPPRQFSVGGVKIDLTPKEYEKFVLYSAGLNPKTGAALGNMPPLKEALGKAVKELKPILDKPLTAKEYKMVTGVVSGIMKNYRDLGKEVMQRDPEIMQRWQRAYAAQNELRQFPGLGD